MLEQPFALPAIIFAVLAVPLVLGLIPRNRFYGVRTVRTLLDDRVWYETNRVAGVAVIVASGIYGAVAKAVPYHRSASNNFSIWVVHLAAFVLPLALGLVVAVRYAKRKQEF